MFEFQIIIQFSDRREQLTHLRNFISHRLNSQNDIYTVENLDNIEDHLRNRLDAWSLDWEPYNPAMVERQRAILRGETEATIYDLNWMKHELIESGLMAQGMGYVEAHRLANEAIGHGPEEDWHLWPTEIIVQYRPYLVGPAWEEAIKERS